MDYCSIGDLGFFHRSITPTLERRAAVAGSEFDAYAWKRV